VARFTQAISEGDGISLVPFLAGDLESLARAADASRAEAVAVESVADVERVRAVSGLPVLLRRRVRTGADLAAAERAGADAIVLGLADFDEDEDEDELEALHASALSRELDCAIEVDDDEELTRALERVDPDIFAISNASDDEDEAFERTLDVLPDVPAGKLVISESRRIVREQVLALERAGVDAILVADVAPGGDFAAALAGLIGGE
jgi:indole-3-glycerol phosphate synthase